MLLHGQSLMGGLPLLSPAFRHSNLRHQVPPRLHDARDPSSEEWNCGREYCPVNLAEMTTSTPFWDLLHPAKYDMWPTALLPFRMKECWAFFRPKNPRTRLPETSTLTPIPPKLLSFVYHKITVCLVATSVFWKLHNLLFKNVFCVLIVLFTTPDSRFRWKIVQYLDSNIILTSQKW